MVKTPPAGRRSSAQERTFTPMNDIILENEALRLRFDRETCCLTELVALQTGWHVLDRPDLGLSFRLMIPLPGQRNNPVYGEHQPASAVALDDDGQGLTLIWNGVDSIHGGHH